MFNKYSHSHSYLLQLENIDVGRAREQDKTVPGSESRDLQL